MNYAQFNEIAWYYFMVFAWQQDDMHKAFRQATHRPPRTKPTSVLDVMIDTAVGASVDDIYITEFVDWATTTMWGEDTAPVSWRVRHNKRRRTV